MVFFSILYQDLTVSSSSFAHTASGLERGRRVFRFARGFTVLRAACPTAGADAATGGRTSRTRTQQGSGPGEQPRRRPRAGAGAGAGVPAAFGCSTAGRRRDPAAGPPATPVPPQPPNAAARSSAGGRRSKVTKMGLISCLLIFCSGSALSREALTIQAAAFWGTLWFF